MTLDGETLCVIVDPNSGENCAVRVWYTFTPTTKDLTVVGVFRLDDDSEIDFSGLAPTQKDKIETACEKQIKENP